MSKKANHLMIGTFVLAAIVIAVAGIVILSAGELFKETQSYIMYFDGDLSGLDVGAPLDFKGVKVGKVTDISIVYDHEDDSVTVPIIVEIDKKCFTEINCDKKNGVKNGMEMHIKKGMRAQLKSQSLVTGKLKITLRYSKKAPEVYKAKGSDLPEIPTMPGSLDSIAQRVSKLPLEDIVVDIQGVTKSLASIANGGGLKRMLESLESLTKRINSLPFESIASDMQATSKAISTMANSGEIKTMMQSLTSTLQESQALMVTINKESRPFREEMLVLMDQFSDAATSIKNLGEYLERHPESLIHGKGKE